MNGTTTRTVAAPSGILTAAVEPGHAWEAVRALRDGIRDVRRSGGEPEVAFLYGIGPDGRLTGLGSAALIVMGYVA